MPAAANFEFAALNEARYYRAALVREYTPWLRGRVLEVGAGIGQMTAEFARVPTVEEIVAIEPEPAFHDAFCAANPGRRLIRGTLAQLPPGEGWDALVAINVLEHIEQDEAELAAWAARLRPRQGCLGLFVPARPELYAPIDRDFGHFRRYTRPVLQARLEAAGVEIERLCYFNFIGYFGWWYVFKLQGRRNFEAVTVRRFDRMIFPAAHWLESRVCRPPFGQSLLAVARAR